MPANIVFFFPLQGGSAWSNCPLLTRQAGVFVIESITSPRWISSIELEGRQGVAEWHLPLRVTEIDENGYDS